MQEYNDIPAGDDDVVHEDMLLDMFEDGSAGEDLSEFQEIDCEDEAEESMWLNGFFPLDGENADEQLNMVRLRIALGILDDGRYLLSTEWGKEMWKSEEDWAQFLLGKKEYFRSRKLYSTREHLFNRLSFLMPMPPGQDTDSATSYSMSAVETHRALRNEAAHGVLSVPGSPSIGFQEATYAFEWHRDIPPWWMGVTIGGFYHRGVLKYRGHDGSWHEYKINRYLGPDIRWTQDSDRPVLNRYKSVWTLGSKFQISERESIKEFKYRFYKDPARLSWFKPQESDRWLAWMKMPGGCLWARVSEMGSSILSRKGEPWPIKYTWSLLKDEKRLAFHKLPKSVRIERQICYGQDWKTIHEMEVSYKEAHLIADHYLGWKFLRKRFIKLLPLSVKRGGEMMKLQLPRPWRVDYL